MTAQKCPLLQRLRRRRCAASSTLFRRWSGKSSGESSSLPLKVSQSEQALKEASLSSRSWHDWRRKNRQGKKIKNKKKWLFQFLWSAISITGAVRSFRKGIAVTNGEATVAALKETLRYGLFLGAFAGTFVSTDEVIGALGGHRRHVLFLSC